MYFCSMSFQQELINWYHLHKRSLPWRDTTDAYVIWLSEIILQQTRVEQGMPYFNKFLAQFPTIADFANATETQVLKLWQGLGYYSRGRNMLYTAQQVRDGYSNVFPMAYDDLIKLKGIGEYTAAAISSFSSNEGRAVVDGNVFRVLSRYFGIATAINSTAGKKEFTQLAQSLILDQEPAVYNQAIMEFGALQCKPKNPDCRTCPLNQNCYALQNKVIDQLPVKIRKMEKRTRYFNYLILKSEGLVAIKLRQAGDIWQHLYDFPLIETLHSFEEQPADLLREIEGKLGTQCQVKSVSKIKHLLTHQIIYVHFFAIDNYIINFSQNTDLKWVSEAELDELPQPKVITEFINNYLIL
jgi:A/G-specific adenine glycosylase